MPFITWIGRTWRGGSTASRSAPLPLPPFGLDGPSRRRALTELVRDLASCGDVVLFEPVSAHGAYAATSRWRDTAGLPVDLIDRGGVFARWLRVNGEILDLVRHADVYAALAPHERRMLESLPCRACVPLVTGGALVAWVVLVDARPEWRLGRSTRQQVTDVASRAAREWQAARAHEAATAQATLVRRAEQLSATGQFAATVAHEVRNPLSAVRSLVQFLRDAPQPAKRQAALLADVLQEVDRIDATVQSLLQLARVEPSAPCEIDLADVVAEAVRFVEPYGRRYGVSVVADTAGPTLFVMADRREVRQVLVNVLLNACQACAGGGTGRVSVSAAVPSGFEDTEAEVTVRDNGPGIAPADLDRIFEPFFTTKPEGTGLGLPFCRDIVHRYGGDIDVVSEPGRGTTVSIRLPLLVSHGVDPRH